MPSDSPPTPLKDRLEAVRHFMEKEVPFNALLGIQLVALECGSAEMRIPYRPELLGDAARPALHGGVTSALIDVTGGTALLTQVQPGDRLSTIDLRIDYLRPAGKADLIARAEVLRLGNRVGVVKIQAFSGTNEEHIAEGTAVYQVKRSRES